jgi:hypothetical protein
VRFLLSLRAAHPLFLPLFLPLYPSLGLLLQLTSTFPAPWQFLFERYSEPVAVSGLGSMKGRRSGTHAVQLITERVFSHLMCSVLVRAPCLRGTLASVSASILTTSTNLQSHVCSPPLPVLLATGGNGVEQLSRRIQQHALGAD